MKSRKGSKLWSSGNYSGNRLGGEDSVEISNRALGQLNTRRNINSDKQRGCLTLTRDLRLRRSCNLPCNFSSIRLARLLPPSEGFVSWDGGWMGTLSRCCGTMVENSNNSRRFQLLFHRHTTFPRSFPSNGKIFNIETSWGGRSHSSKCIILEPVCMNNWTLSAISLI